MTTARQEPPPDGATTRIGQAVMLHRAGDREEARNRLGELWEQTSQADAFQRCTIAHYMADTQDDPADELAWDLRALAAADLLTGDHAASGTHAVEVRVLYPSLHLNLAADHVKLGAAGEARRELDRARRAAHVLTDDDYGRGILAAIDRMERRLDQSDQRP
ncbi:hypothetical protein N566_26350 [Streptomycetaceae bacterium MP113-05]|nr:hypothetical protein N566_26350 [Streptomycetaceae bacterium MP113-05]